MLLMTLLMSYPLSPHLVGPLVDAKIVHQQKQGPNLTRLISKCTPKRSFPHVTRIFDIFIPSLLLSWFPTSFLHLVSRAAHLSAASIRRGRPEQRPEDDNLN